MAIKVPVAQNFQNPIVSQPCRLFNDPPNGEGQRFCALEIDWSLYSQAAGNAVLININSQGVQNMSQICAIGYDNSGCGTDVRLIFPDSQTTYTIPADSPTGMIEVVTNQTQFYVEQVDGTSESIDVTQLTVMNFTPYPYTVPPPPQDQDTAGANNIPANTTGLTNIIPTGVSGTIEALSLFAQLLEGASAGSLLGNVQDGTGKVIANFGASSNSSTNVSVQMLTLNPVAIRFTNGLYVDVTTASSIPSGSTIIANVYYRIP